MEKSNYKEWYYHRENDLEKKRKGKRFFDKLFLKFLKQLEEENGKKYSEEEKNGLRKIFMEYIKNKIINE